MKEQPKKSNTAAETKRAKEAKRLRDEAFERELEIRRKERRSFLSDEYFDELDAERGLYP